MAVQERVPSRFLLLFLGFFFLFLTVSTWSVPCKLPTPNNRHHLPAPPLQTELILPWLLRRGVCAQNAGGIQPPLPRHSVSQLSSSVAKLTND